MITNSIKTILRVLVIGSLLSMTACKSNKKSDGSSIDPDGQVTGEQSPIEVSDLENSELFSQGSDSGNISGLSTIYFGYDRSQLSAEARTLLAANVEWIRSNTNASMILEGHCDQRGSTEYNLALGERRAKVVKNYLVSLGVPADRISVVSYGEEKLKGYGDTEYDHTQNRRVNFVPTRD